VGCQTSGRIGPTFDEGHLRLEHGPELAFADTITRHFRKSTSAAQRRRGKHANSPEEDDALRVGGVLLLLELPVLDEVGKDVLDEGVSKILVESNVAENILCTFPRGRR
jgi:hypothetical protein